MRDTFHISQHIIPAALLVMGYPSEEAKPQDLHSKYRPLNEVVVYDNFM